MVFCRVFVGFFFWGGGSFMVFCRVFVGFFFFLGGVHSWLFL